MSGFLLDTNVLSETAKARRDPGVMAFLAGLDAAYLSVLSIHELTYGLERLEPGTKRRLALTKVSEALLATFESRVLPIEPPEARAAAAMRVHAASEGRTVHLADALIAATALVHGLTVVTRNVSDFEGLGVLIRNPWQR